MSCGSNTGNIKLSYFRFSLAVKICITTLSSQAPNNDSVGKLFCRRPSVTQDNRDLVFTNDFHVSVTCNPIVEIRLRLAK